MALKDWEKGRTEKQFDHISYKWTHKNYGKDNYLGITIFNWRKIKGTKNYEIMITDWPEQKFWKNKLTKSQALNYAKAYMKKH
jgi:hypothetical protein